MAESESDITRLKELCRWCVEGRLAAAELELTDWVRTPACPAQARTLLAHLQIRRRDREAALATLEPVMAKDADAGRLVLALSLSWDQVDGDDRLDCARELMRKLMSVNGRQDELEAWAEVAAPELLTESDRANPAKARELAAQLQEHPEALGSLVAAMRANPDAKMIGLIRKAIDVMPLGKQSKDRQVAVCQAGATLAELAGDEVDARRWAHEGIAISPRNAALALVLSRLPDDLGAGPSAIAVLRGATFLHPNYPDLQAALVRRQIKQGQTQAAKRTLELWKQRHPDHPLALQVERELAA